MAEEQSNQRGGALVQAVYLKLGPLAGVVKEALLSSYELARENTVAAGSRLLIEEIPVVIYCRQCQMDRPLPDIRRFACPSCGAPAPEVVKGRELEVVALELAC